MRGTRREPICSGTVVLTYRIRERVDTRGIELACPRTIAALLAYPGKLWARQEFIGLHQHLARVRFE